MTASLSNDGAHVHCTSVTVIEDKCSTSIVIKDKYVMVKYLNDSSLRPQHTRGG